MDSSLPMDAFHPYAGAASLHWPWENLPDSPGLHPMPPPTRSAPAVSELRSFSAAGKHNLANTAHLYSSPPALSSQFSPSRLLSPFSPFMPGSCYPLFGFYPPPGLLSPASCSSTPRSDGSLGHLTAFPFVSSPETSPVPPIKTLPVARNGLSSNMQTPHPQTPSAFGGPTYAGSEKPRYATSIITNGHSGSAAKTERPSSGGCCSDDADHGDAESRRPAAGRVGDAVTAQQSVRNEPGSSTSRRKRKPPPICIDSRISNFSQPLHTTTPFSCAAPRSAPAVSSLSLPKREALSPVGRSAYSPMSSPLVASANPYSLFVPEYAGLYQQYCHAHGQAPLLGTPLSPLYNTPLPYNALPLGVSMALMSDQLGTEPSSGYSSATLDVGHSPHMFTANHPRPPPASALQPPQHRAAPLPKGISGQFAFLCFLPGTQLKILMGEDSPAAIDWQSAEAYQMNNVKLELEGNLRLVNYIISDTAVELNLKPTEPAGESAAVKGAYGAGQARGRCVMSIRALCPPYHPFCSPDRGWVALDPMGSLSVCGMVCQQLSISDVILAHPPDPHSGLFLPFGLGWQQTGLGMPSPSAGAAVPDWHQHRSSGQRLDGAANPVWHLASPSSGLIENQLLPGNRQPRIRHKDKKRDKERERDDKTKRPMNAFMLFAQQYRVRYTQEFPGRDNRAISCMLGDHWKRLSPEEKQRYTDQAKQLAVSYKEKNPNCWKRRSSSRSDADAQTGLPMHALTPTTTTAGALNALVLGAGAGPGEVQSGWQGSSAETSPSRDVDIVGSDSEERMETATNGDENNYGRLSRQFDKSVDQGVSGFFGNNHAAIVHSREIKRETQPPPGPL